MNLILSYFERHFLFETKKIKYIEFSKDADMFVGDIYITFTDNVKKTVFSEAISQEEYEFLKENLKQE